jgi:hypothetical protein
MFDGVIIYLSVVSLFSLFHLWKYIRNKAALQDTHAGPHLLLWFVSIAYTFALFSLLIRMRTDETLS